MATIEDSVTPADPTQWCETSRRSLAAEYVRAYKDIAYTCWKCKAPAVFTARDQKHAFEVKKVDVNQRRNLCSECWKRERELAVELRSLENRWAEAKNQLQKDRVFLARWLEVLQMREQYVPYRPDTAKKQMLKKQLASIDV